MNAFLPSVTVSLLVLYSSAVHAQTGPIRFRCNYTDVTKMDIHLWQPPNPQNKEYRTIGKWTVPYRKESRSLLSSSDQPVEVNADSEISVSLYGGKNAGSSAPIALKKVAVFGANGWEVLASCVRGSVLPKVTLPIVAKRGSSTWEIDKNGIVTSHIKFTVGAGNTKKYGSALVVEFSDGSSYKASATASVGGLVLGTRTGTKTNSEHDAIPYGQLQKIRRIYVKFKSGSTAPGTVREWVNTFNGWAKEADVIYKDLKQNELVKDAVRFYAAG